MGKTGGLDSNAVGGFAGKTIKREAAIVWGANFGVRPSPGAAIDKKARSQRNIGAMTTDHVAASGTDAPHPGRVWINDRQYIEGVPESAWTFPIGGYLPAQRWLKDRIGRTLGFVEQEEYMRIIWALMETKRLMSEIDASIEQHGGWPLK